MRLKLQHVAHVRAGDKGNTSNISVIAYADELYPLLKEQLTAERFKAHYRGAITGPVHRYAVDGLCVLNFVCEGALGGGVSRILVPRQLRQGAVGRDPGLRTRRARAAGQPSARDGRRGRHRRRLTGPGDRHGHLAGCARGTNMLSAFLIWFAQRAG